MATNLLEAVTTYNEAGLAALDNLSPYIYHANKKYVDWEKQLPQQLGDTIDIALPTRFSVNTSLVADFQAIEQRKQPLKIDKEYSTSYAFTSQELILNVNDCLETFVKGAITEIGTVIVSDFANVNLTNTYRAFGDGITPINSEEQYAQAIANFRNYGAAKFDTNMFVSDVDIPAAVGNSLSQFTVNRNNEYANSWQLGNFAGCEFSTSNLLPIHTAGTVGNFQEELTLESISPDGTTLTFSGALDDPAAIVENDILTFDFPGSTNTTGLRFLTFVGHVPSSQLVQVRATATAASVGGQVTVTVNPPLIFSNTTPPSPNANVNIDPNTLTGILNARIAPDHRAGLLYSGNALFLAMPPLNDNSPFTTSVKTDMSTGASMRAYHGSKFGENQYGFVNDAIAGFTLIDEYAMRIIYPLSGLSLTAAYGNYNTIRDKKAKEAAKKLAATKAK
jgi:hypothetical protein